MDRSLKWRTIVLVGLLALSIATLIPSFAAPGSLPTWFSSMFDKRVNLGLDLQGGVHVIYSIDLDRAVDDRAFEIKRDLETKFAEEKIQGVVKATGNPVGAVNLVIADDATRTRVAAETLSTYSDVLVTATCGSTGDAKLVAQTTCFRVSSSFADGIKKAALTNAVNTVRERIDGQGIAESSVIEKGEDIIVELPGVDEDRIDGIKDLIRKTAKLEFKMVVPDSQFMSVLAGHVIQDPAAAAAGVTSGEEAYGPEGRRSQFSDYYLRAFDRSEALPLDEAKRIGCFDKDKPIADGKMNCTVQGRYLIERYMKELAATAPRFQVPDDMQIGYELQDRGDEADSRPYWRTYFLERAARLSGSSISNAVATYDPQTGFPEVAIEFNRYGSRVFGDMTAASVGRKFATILDDTVKSAPVINLAIRGGRASITMGGGDAKTQEVEADALVAVLKTGSLPAPLREESSSVVGPSLGRDAIDKAKLAFGLGIVLVVVIMVYIYRLSGFIAVGAVLVNVVLMMAVMAVFGATLTLPGIAAVVLTVGMAVDGNILIYERIRDELVAGKSVRGAVDLGFSRAFSAILDGQLTTAAAGFVLLQFGSGPIKGFAVMLLVGIGTTLFTNIWVSRLLFDWYVAKKKGSSATISI